LATLEQARYDYGTRPLEREIMKFKEWSGILASKPSNFPSGFA
jgi:hypothetical protein